MVISIFTDRFINIQRDFSRGKIETPKCGKSRKVHVSLQLTQTLLDLRHQRKMMWSGMGQGPGMDFPEPRRDPFGFQSLERQGI